MDYFLFGITSNRAEALRQEFMGLKYAIHSNHVALKGLEKRIEELKTTNDKKFEELKTSNDKHFKGTLAVNF